MNTHRRPIALLAVLVLAGCAQPSPSAPDANMPGMTRWDFSPPLDGDGMHIALINAARMENALQLYCHEPSKDLVLQIVPRDIEGDAREQALTLAYDDGPPISQHWRASMYKGRFFEFSLAGDEPGFETVIRDLKTHRSVEIVIYTAGKEVRRDRFSLERAPETIDRVLATCGRPTSAM